MLVGSSLFAVGLIRKGVGVCYQGAVGKNMHMGIGSFVKQHQSNNKDHQTCSEMFYPLTAYGAHPCKITGFQSKRKYLLQGIFPGELIYTNSNLGSGLSG